MFKNIRLDPNECDRRRIQSQLGGFDFIFAFEEDEMEDEDDFEDGDDVDDDEFDEDDEEEEGDTDDD